MSMNKAIHGAFRRDLTRFLEALDAFRDGDRARASQLHAAWANFEDQLTRHHEGEHEIAWPALRAVGADMAVIEQMDAEHDELAAALASTDAAMNALGQSASGADAAKARAEMAGLKSAATRHMDHEEAEIEPLYVAKRDDPAIKAMGRKFGKVSPPVAGTFFAWLADGSSPEEMAAIKENVPGPVFAVLNGLFGRRYRREVAPAWR